jgi:hypothetical protein
VQELTPEVARSEERRRSNANDGVVLVRLGHSFGEFSARGSDSLYRAQTVEHGAGHRRKLLLLQHLARCAEEHNDCAIAAYIRQRAREADRRRALVKRTVTGHEQLSADTVHAEPDAAEGGITMPRLMYGS